jgi:hypothetical protein
MNDRFDAYHQWLGIPPDEQPPDFYRLLGLARLESDTQLVATAAQRQVAKIKETASREHLALAQKLVKQIAKARSTLMDPKLRAQYNEQLQRVTRAQPAVQVGTADVQPSDLAAPVQVAPAPSNIELTTARAASATVRCAGQAQPVVIKGGLDLTSSSTGARATHGSGRKKVSVDYRFPLLICLLICVVGAGVALAIRLPDVLNNQNENSLIERGQGIGLTGTRGKQGPGPNTNDSRADSKSSAVQKQANDKAGLPKSETAPQAVVAKSAEEPAHADAGSKSKESPSLAPESKGKDPLKNDLSPDDVSDDVFRTTGDDADDQTADDQTSGEETSGDETAGEETVGSGKTGDRKSGAKTRQQQKSRPPILTLEEEQAKHGQRPNRQQVPEEAAEDGEQ